MKSIITTGVGRTSIVLVLCLFFGFTLPTNALSNEQYQISREIKASVPLSPDQFFEVVFLTTRTVFHTLEAATALELEDTQGALEETKKARALIAVVDKMLPETNITIQVEDDQGSVLYDDIRNVQIREIPIYQGMTNVQVVRPIIKFRKQQEVTEEYKTDYNMDIFSQVWVDIRYFEGRLIGAQAYLKANKTDEAYNTLAEALNIGVRIEYAEAVREYADAVRYLVLATNQAEAGDAKGAAKSLKKAGKSLSKYAKNESMADDPNVQAFLKDLKTMEDEMGSVAKPGKIRALWYKLFKGQPRT